MRKSHYQYVLIGAGTAAGAAAGAIRGVDANGPVLLVGQEISRPYHRPLLSRDYLLGRKRHEELFTHEAGWFAKNRIDLRTHRRAEQLDCGRRSVFLDDGEEVAFDVLLLATGAGPKHLTVPGANLPNVFYLRTIEDADRLRHAIDAAHKQYLPANPARPPRTGVIGSGLLGLELAATLTQLGLQVDLFSKDAQPWKKFLGEGSGKSVARYMEGRGVAMHLGAPVVALQGDGRAQRVVCGNGEVVTCDLVVVAIGVTAHKELLRGTPVAAERGILTDEYGRTNVPGIFAAGDCAARFDPLFGKHRFTDHWDAAVASGRVAGMAMAEKLVKEEEVSGFATTVFDLTVRSYGEPRVGVRRLTRMSAGEGSPVFTEFAVDAGGKLAQVVTSDGAVEDGVLRQLVSKRISVEGYEELLKDPNVPLERLL